MCCLDGTSVVIKLAGNRQARICWSGVKSHMIESARIKSAVATAMRESDTLALQIVYLDRDGCRTRRYVSPIRFVGPEKFLALCLSRESPRIFELEYCSQVQFVPTVSLQMPTKIEQLGVDLEFLKKLRHKK